MAWHLAVLRLEQCTVNMNPWSRGIKGFTMWQLLCEKYRIIEIHYVRLWWTFPVSVKVSICLRSVGYFSSGGCALQADQAVQESPCTLHAILQVPDQSGASTAISLSGLIQCHALHFLSLAATSFMPIFVVHYIVWGAKTPECIQRMGRRAYGRILHLW